MPLPMNFTPSQLTITYQQPVNNSASVLTASVNVNLQAVTANVNVDVGSYVAAILQRGYWNGVSFIPPRMITLITAS